MPFVVLDYILLIFILYPKVVMGSKDPKSTAYVRFPNDTKIECYNRCSVFPCS